jgi:hypothetical protein
MKRFVLVIGVVFLAILAPGCGQKVDDPTVTTTTTPGGISTSTTMAGGAGTTTTTLPGAISPPGFLITTTTTLGTSTTTSTASTTTTLATVAAPTFAPVPGSYEADSLLITFECATAGAEIYYTLDGSTPSTGSTLYAASFLIEVSKTIKAMAVKAGMLDSAVTSGRYDLYWWAIKL